MNNNIVDPQKLYSKIKDIIKNKLDKITYNRWIKTIKLSIENNNIFIITVPNELFGSIFKNKFENIFKNTLKQILNEENIQIQYKIEKLNNNFTKKNNTDNIKINNHNTIKRKIHNFNDKNTIKCNIKFTFDNFVVGDANKFAHSAAIAVSNSHGKLYNPLFIYGDTGLGKTHLIQAIAHKISNNENNILRVEYITCEEFVNLYIESLLKNNSLKFRRYIRNIDILLIDDIHFLSGKTSMQEEFFNTFNTLYNENKQIILTSDCSPGDIKGVESRLISRFELGLTTDIQKPSLELRLAILKKKQENQKIKLNDDILYFIANKIYSNIRKLEGAIIKLITYSSITQEEMTINEAENILLPMIAQEPYIKITIDIILKKISEYYNIKIQEIIGRKRSKDITYIRMLAMYLSRISTNNSLLEIGNNFNRTHATVINAISKITNMIKTNNNKINTTIDILKLKFKQSNK